MHRLLLILIPAVLMLCPSCASKLSEIRDDIGTLAKNGVAITKAVRELPAQMDAKFEAAATTYRNLGAPVDGSPAGILGWAAKNPGAVSTGGLIPFLLVLARAWLAERKKKQAAEVDAAKKTKAVNAMVDTIDAAGPTATKSELLAAFSSHPQMDGDARLVVAQAKAR